MKEKVIIIFSSVFIIFMGILLIYYLIKGDSSRWHLSAGGMAVSALPLLLLRMKHIPFTIPIIIGYYAFIFASIFLGSICSFYLRHMWYDSALHLIKGMYVSFAGISLYKHLVPENVRLDASNWILFLFVFSLSVLASVIWEIYEFIGDLTFTHTMQLGGNKDTMIDLLCGFAGAFLIAIYSGVRKQQI